MSSEDIVVREYLESQSVSKLKNFAGTRQTLIVDEAQYVQQIGSNLKLLADHVEGLRIIATGTIFVTTGFATVQLATSILLCESGHKDNNGHCYLDAKCVDWKFSADYALVATTALLARSGILQSSSKNTISRSLKISDNSPGAST